MGLSDAPALLEGVHPVPPAMARLIAADEPLWHRVLTDPADGTYLPVAARQYRPGSALREHLRLTHPVCAVPGCTRSTTHRTEADHILEYNHRDPAAGGLTGPANLHLLCRNHHRLKTSHLIDPVRGPDPSITHWSTRSGVRARDVRDRDLTTPALAAALQDHWDMHQWDAELRALDAQGEIDRILRESGPPDLPRPDPPPF